ncbi:zinc-dependent metalloprotease [Chitinophaga pendula]|uniref:M57 family metalloprotease n=1 Tax=Chitinophaga TaxID=79328 RepID=UPI0012FD01DD|nr:MULTISPECIES: M57 family metalloprotease [Chitinophaga]UCJ08352.1 zinc-dependent metalloprotease [Chitinophaga pendula]
MKTTCIFLGICLICFACQKEPAATKINSDIPADEKMLYPITHDVTTEDVVYPPYILSGPRNIRVRVAALPTVLVTALGQALNNYNVLQLKLQFSLVNTTADITLQGRVMDSSILAVSGYPSQDKPYPTITVNTGPHGLLNPANAGIVRRVIQHELGHCIGLLHPDRNVLRPCGPPTETPLPVINVPGMPGGLDTLSLMLRCNPGNVFSPRDIQLLKWMYGRP